MNKCFNDYLIANSSPQCSPAKQCHYDDGSDDSFYSLSPIPLLDSLSNSCLPLSPIPQIDGIIDITQPSPLPTINPSANASPATHLPSVTTRNVDYALNRDKHLRKLQKDATIDDFNIEINNKDQNVNIHCNTGFYTTVAVPALQGLSSGQIKVVQGITVQCQDIIGNFDSSNANQTTILYFRLSQNKESLGCVRIHLHHTARKVQLQGSSVLPDQKSAPVWFTDCVLKEHFTRMSREKSSDIRKFNQSVSGMISTHLTKKQEPQKCEGCKAPFNKRSTPEYCPQCNLFFHKFKCYPTPKHPCNNKKRSLSCNTVTVQDNTPVLKTSSHPSTHQCVSTNLHSPSGTLGSLPTHRTMQLEQRGPTQQALVQASDNACTAPTQPTGDGPTVVDTLPTPAQTDHDTVGGSFSTDSNTPTDHHTVPVLPPLLPRSSTLARNDPTALQSGSLVIMSTLSDQTTSTAIQDSSLNPLAVPFVRTSPEQTQKRPRGKQKKTPVPADTKEVEIEFLKAEISTLQAKLQSLQSEVTDVRFRNTILMDRNKVLEEAKKKDIHDRYFPPSDHHIPPGNCYGRSSHSCCAGPAMYHHCGSAVHQEYSHQTTQVPPGSHSNDTLVAMDLKIEKLCKAVQELQDLLGKPTEPAVPVVSAEPEVGMHRSTSANVTVNTTPHSTQSPQRDTPVSLDGFMFGDEPDTVMHDLNS